MTSPMNRLREVRTITASAPKSRKEAVRLGADMASAAIAKSNPLAGLVARLVIGRPKMVLAVIVSSVALVSFIVLFTFITVVGLFTQVALTPVQIAASVVGWVPGLGPSDPSEEAPPQQLCFNQPTATLTPTPTPQAQVSDVPEGADLSTPAPAPPAPTNPRTALSDNGRITEWPMELARQAPSGAQARQVQAWLLFALAHPDDPRAKSWDAFGEPYGQAVRLVSDQASGSDIAATIDPAMDYQPYTLVAASLTFVGILDHRFQDPTDLSDNLANTVIMSCRTQSGNPATKTAASGDPVLPARNPGWSTPESSVTPAPSEGQSAGGLSTVSP